MGSAGSRRTAAQVVEGKNLKGITAIVTGGTSGIGLETVKALASKGAHVIVPGRNKERLMDLAKIHAPSSPPDDVRKHALESDEDGGGKRRKGVKGEANQVYKDIPMIAVGDGHVEGMICDLESLESIQSFAKEYLKKKYPLDLIICNAGVMMSPLLRTEDGFELQMGVNHLGHFALVLPLLPLLRTSCAFFGKGTKNENGIPLGRVVMVSSLAHQVFGGAIDVEDLNWEKKPYGRVGAYQQSKLANVLFAKELTAKEATISNVKAYALHPGTIAGTNLSRHFLPGFLGWMRPTLGFFMGKSPQQGAATSVYCALEALDDDAGKYYTDCAVAEPSVHAFNKPKAKELWELSEKLTHVVWRDG